MLEYWPDWGKEGRGHPHPRPHVWTSLEPEVQSELHLAHIGRLGSDPAGVSYVYGILGYAEIRVIGSIEIFPSEFQCFCFCKDELFRERQIEYILCRSPKRALGGRTVPKRLLRRSVGVGVEPQVAVGIGNMRIADDIRPRVVEVGV